ncbi:MAG: laccase domain-containing protein, partial [Pseudomonadales bacterium]
FKAIQPASSQAKASASANTANTPLADAAGSGNQYLADLYQLATLALHRNGVQHIYGGGFCTFSDPKRFFSYRRDGITGRMASFIFIDA